MRPHLHVAYPARQVTNLEGMTQNLFTTWTLIADVIWAAIREEPLSSFSPLRLLALAALEAVLAWNEHLCGEIAVGSIHDEASDVLGHGERGSLDG